MQRFKEASKIIFIPAILALFLFPISCSSTQETASVDRHIKLKAVQGSLRYDKTEFEVPPGETVKITLSNPSNLKHNLLLFGEIKKQKAVELAKETWKNTEGANKFVPNSEHVLHVLETLQPGETGSITFQAPKEKGKHPYVCTLVGHAESMNGIMHVR